MAYAKTNPPVKLSNAPLAGFNTTESGSVGGALWRYQSTDAIGTVQGAGYISNGQDLGMQVGDVVFVHVTNASPYAVYIAIVTSLSGANKSVTLSSTTTTTIN